MGVGTIFYLPTWNYQWEKAVEDLRAPIEVGEEREIQVPPLFLWTILDSNVFRLGFVGHGSIHVLVVRSLALRDWCLEVGPAAPEKRPGFMVWLLEGVVGTYGLSVVSAVGGVVSNIGRVGKAVSLVDKIGPALSAKRALLEDDALPAPREMADLLAGLVFYNFEPGWEPWDKREPSQFLAHAVGYTVARSTDGGFAALHWRDSRIRAHKVDCGLSFDPSTWDPVSWDLGVELSSVLFERARLVRVAPDPALYVAPPLFQGKPF